MFLGIVTLSFVVGPGPRVLSLRVCEPCLDEPLGPTDGDRAGTAGRAVVIAGFGLGGAFGKAGGPLDHEEMRDWDD